MKIPKRGRPDLAIKVLLCLAALPLAGFSRPQDYPEFEPDPEQSAKIANRLLEDLSDRSAAKSPFQQKIRRSELSISIRNIRLKSGKQVTLVYAAPKKAQKVPAVFLLDVEAINLSNNSPAVAYGSRYEQKRLQRTRYLLRSPFATNLLGNGFAVAYLVAEDVRDLRSARSGDWMGVFEKVRDMRQVDIDSFFLLSTREYANLSLFLASRYNFAGVVLETPPYMLFSRDTFEEVVKDSLTLSSREIWNRTDPSREFRYESILSKISSPILLIRNPQSKAYSFNQKTLIAKLDRVEAYYDTVEIPGAGRALKLFGGAKHSGLVDTTPEVVYDPQTISLWVDEIIDYMREYSAARPIAMN